MEYHAICKLTEQILVEGRCNKSTLRKTTAWNPVLLHWCGQCQLHYQTEQAIQHHCQSIFIFNCHWENTMQRLQQEHPKCAWHTYKGAEGCPPCSSYLRYFHLESYEILGNMGAAILDFARWWSPAELGRRGNQVIVSQISLGMTWLQSLVITG